MGWIKTSERLPEEFGQVIVNNRVPEAREQDVVICAVFFKGKFYNLEYWGNNDPSENGSIEIWSPSHWMPLPEAPTN
jgi:hypothetical protein